MSKKCKMCLTPKNQVCQNDTGVCIEHILSSVNRTLLSFDTSVQQGTGRTLKLEYLSFPKHLKNISLFGRS